MEEFSDEIGERLRVSREKAGLSVEDIHFRTRIPVSVIHALEAADFSVFSSPTYAKSYLAQYSDFLGVDARLWLDALQPASFISGDVVRPVWEAAQPKKEPVQQEVATGGGWFSAAVLLLVSSAMVLAAIGGYRFFDDRFGSESLSDAAAPERPEPVEIPAARPEPPVEKAPEPLTQNPDDDISEPPPRAIIVR